MLSLNGKLSLSSCDEDSIVWVSKLSRIVSHTGILLGVLVMLKIPMVDRLRIGMICYMRMFELQPSNDLWERAGKISRSTSTILCDGFHRVEAAAPD